MQIRLALPCLLLGLSACTRDAGHETKLTDEEFWNVSTALSEPTGTFAHSDNLVSNEMYFVHTIRMLHPTGGAYVRVGPEQPRIFAQH
jgi:hypothetical protein